MMEAEKTKESLLVLDKVSKRFTLENGRELEVLKNINVSVLEGEIIAFLGPSGCGKTTMLKIMAGLTEPTQGQVLVKGKPLQGINTKLAMVFQNPALLPWYTVEQNVALGLHRLRMPAEARDQRVEENIDLVGIGGFEGAYPRELSGGLRQRVGLARALAMRPEILCLDEPFGSLDALTAEDLRAEVVDLWRDHNNDLRTVVMVTHDIYEAVYMAQRIYVYGENPGHIRTVLHNPMPYPRDERSPKYRELVEVIHAVITEALIPEEESGDGTQVQPSWYQGLENLPAVGPNEIVGLLEVIEGAGGKMDIFELANETESEFGHCLAVVKTAELLDFVDTPKQTVIFTKLGRNLVRTEGQERRDIFSGQIGQLRVFQVLLSWIEESADKEISHDEVINRLQGYFPNEKLDRLFETLVAFGRYAEILAYDANTLMLSLPDEEEDEEEPQAPPPPQAT
ncbi:MAG: nitrate/sulfonate/bicarbonate ABC transporter ATP-binding protein [Bdellovibrionota bacterium]